MPRSEQLRQSPAGEVPSPSPALPAAAPPSTPAEWLAGHDYALVFRASVAGHGKPQQGRGPASGRYRLWARSGRTRCERVAHQGLLASAEAGYATLIAALTDLIARIDGAGVSPSAFSIAIYSQDELVIKQLDGSHRVKAPGLQPLHAEASALLARFGRHTVVWGSSRTVATANI
jgi:probable phosphoglycerate mutase